MVAEIRRHELLDAGSLLGIFRVPDAGTFWGLGGSASTQGGPFTILQLIRPSANHQRPNYLALSHAHETLKTLSNTSSLKFLLLITLFMKSPQSHGIFQHKERRSGGGSISSEHRRRHPSPGALLFWSKDLHLTIRRVSPTCLNADDHHVRY